MIVTAGKTNVSVYYYIVQDASGTSPGEPATGLLFSDIETGGSASYARQGAARVDLTLKTLASASAAHDDGGFILVDDTNMPGLYRCDYPDAAFATGVDQTYLSIVVASANNAVAAPILVDITDVDLRDSVRGGMTALPNAAADAAGGLATSAGGATGIDDLATPTNITAGTITTTTNLTNAATSGDLTATMKTSVTTAATAATPIAASVAGNVDGSTASVTGAVGSVTGSVGSVTGAVGSVTGNVGGNVVGSTASVTGAVGSVTGNIGGNVTGSVGSVVGDTKQTADHTASIASILTDTGTTLPAQIYSQGIQKNTAFSNYEFLMVLTSDHVTPATGLTVTGQRSIDGGAFASVSGSIAEVSNGIYQFDALAADTNGDVITWRFSSATADDVFETFTTIV